MNPDFLSKLAYALVPARRETVLENLRIVFGRQLSAVEIKKIAQCFYGHCLQVILETLAATFMTERQLKERVEVVGHEILLEAASQKKGILILTGHFGNWELASVGAMLGFEEFYGRFHVLRRRLVNKTIEKMLFGRFYRSGLNIIPKKQSLERVLEALGRNDVVAFVMDQYANPAHGGIEVDFFGRKAGTFKSLALVAGRSGAPVIPAHSYRQKDGRHVMRFSRSLPWIEHPDPEVEIYQNTLAYNRALEKMVLEHPDQWFCWAHRRWKVKTSAQETA
jgi:KDO2-lipid IV(A) lauroyltransferase